MARVHTESLLYLNRVPPVTGLHTRWASNPENTMLSSCVSDSAHRTGSACASATRARSAIRTALTSVAEVDSHEANSSKKANVACTRSAKGLSMWASVVNPNVPQSEAYPVL